MMITFGGRFLKAREYCEEENVMPKLRYFQTYDEFGVDSDKELQYWDEEYECWMPVNLIRVWEDREFDFNTKDDC